MDVKDIKKIELEITSNCNAGCPNCVRTIFPANYTIGSITLGDIKRIFPTKEYIDEKIFLLCGQLGDPVINKDCYDICEYVINNNGWIIINTNASLKSPEWWKKLGELSASSGRLKVWFCVDGHEETNSIYRIDTNFKLIKRNMTAFSSAGGDGVWMFIVFNHNKKELDKCKKEAKDLGFKFSTRVSAGQTKPDTALTKIGDKVARFLKSKLMKIEKDDISCRLVHEGEIFITYDQKVLPCCYLQRYAIRRPEIFSKVFESYDKNWNSVKHHSLEEILSHEWFNSILEDSWDTKHKQHITCCEGCKKTKRIGQDINEDSDGK